MTTLADTIRRLDGEGTPGPWTAHLRECFLAEDATGATVYEVWSHMPYEKFDNDLIVTLRNHAAEIADALEAVERVRGLHVPFEWSFGFGPVRSCKHCAEQGADEAHAQWPCPTIRALDGEK